MNIKQKTIFSIFVTGLLFFATVLHAEDGQLSDKLMALEARLNHIQTTQQEILANDSKIKAELQTLKIWIHKHP